MKKNRLCHILIGIFFLTWGIAVLPEITHAAEDSSGAILILTDVSGSMQDKAPPFENKKQGDNKQEKCMSKAEVMKELLVQITQELSGKPCKLGIYRMCYKAGFDELYAPFLPIDNYNEQEIKDAVIDKYITKYPVFNRRTPIADTLRQLDKNEFDAIKGRITVLLVSDGKESFYDLEKDQKNTETKDEKVRGPLTETKLLKEKYGQALSIYTVFMEDQSESDAKKNGENDPEGAVLLSGMASAGGGKTFVGNKLLEDKSLITELTDLLCYEKSEQKQAQITQTPPPPPVITSAGPKDSDKDGVYDDTDKCPGTPQGADVNEKGCWVLKGVNFDTAKWNIKPDFFPILDRVTEVLKQNPELRVEVQGHTDNRGSEGYNKRLSEKRAASVKEYFIQKGIDPARLTSSGYGFSKPMFSNDTAENRAKNRRVELTPIR